MQLTRTLLAQGQRIIMLTKLVYVQIHQVDGSNLVDICVEGYLVCGCIVQELCSLYLTR